MVEFRVLGPLEVADGVRHMSLGGAKERALLARLLLAPNQVLSVDRLIEDVWEEDPPDSASVSLRVLISRLRKALATIGATEAVVTRAPGYVLIVDPSSIDAARFESLFERGRNELAAGEPTLAAATLRDALALWRGPAFADVAYATFARAESARLEEARLAAIEERIDADLAWGRPEIVIGEVEGLCATHPLRERLWAQRMLALYRSGRQAEALSAYQRLRHALAEELGIDPSPELRALEAAILRQDAALTPAAPATTSTATTSTAATSTPTRKPVLVPSASLPSGVVSFLLTDIASSTELWETDLDGMASALARHDVLVDAVIGRTHGHVVKSKGEGDATLSVFRRASDAIAAALELRTAFTAEQWPNGIDLQVRIAVHTGEAQEREGDYFGPTVNRAARLRSIAEGNQILLSQSAAELVRDRLPEQSTLEDLGLHELRGLSRSERVFALLPAASSALATMPPTAAFGMAGDQEDPDDFLEVPLPQPLRLPEGSAFVGRTAELDRLTAQWDEVLTGECRLVFIAGEPGIGKTRLAGQFAALAHTQGATVLYGRSDEDAGTAYQPFAEALRDYVLTCPAEVLRDHVARYGSDVALLVPEISRRLPDLPAGPSGDPDSERMRLFDALTGLLAAASQRSPMILLLDDLHWAAKPTLLLLRHLLRCSDPMRILVIGTYRDTDLDREHPLADALAGLQREGVGVQRLLVRGLTAEDVAAYVEAVGGQSLGEDESALARALHSETEGNPFFVAEVLRHLVETGALYRQDERWLLKSLRIEDLGLPQGVRDVITQRLSRLSDTANRALAVASVVGPTFSLRILESVQEVTPGGEDLIDAMDEALASGIVAESGANNYTFSHALIRQTLYSELSSAKRTRLHRRVGEAIESLLDADRHLDALAHHFAEAAIDGQATKAASYALSASAAAMSRLSFEEAVSALERGISALELTTADPSLHADLLLALSDARHASGVAGSREAALSAATMARAVGSPERLGQAALLLARQATLGIADPEAAAVCEEALVSIPKAEPALRARVLGELARYRAYAETDRSGAQGLIDEAIALARSTQDPATLAAVLGSATFTWFGSERPEEIIRLGDELVSLCEQIGDSRGRYDGLVARAIAKRQRGDMRGFHTDLEAIEELARESHSWFGLAVTASLQATQAMLEGRFEDVAHHLAAMVNLGGSDPNVVNFRIATTILYAFESGELVPVIAQLESFIAARPGIPGVRAALAGVQAMAGLDGPPRETLRALLLDDCAALPRDASWSLALGFLAETAGYLGDRQAAEILRPKLVPYSGQLLVVGRTGCYGTADRSIAILAMVLEDWDTAERHFTQAETLDQQIGAPPYLARTQMWHARMLLARAGLGDRARARDLLETALATAEKLGMPSLAADVRSLQSR